MLSRTIGLPADPGSFVVLITAEALISSLDTDFEASTAAAPFLQADISYGALPGLIGEVNRSAARCPASSIPAPRWGNPDKLELRLFAGACSESVFLRKAAYMERT